MSFHDRRRTARIPVNERVRLSIGGEHLSSCSGRVTDCSDDGLAVRANRSASPGETLLIEWQYGYFAGVVRSCLAEEEAWRLGIELEDLRSYQALMFCLKESACPPANWPRVPSSVTVDEIGSPFPIDLTKHDSVLS